MMAETPEMPEMPSPEFAAFMSGEADCKGRECRWRYAPSGNEIQCRKCGSLWGGGVLYWMKRYFVVLAERARTASEPSASAFERATAVLEDECFRHPAYDRLAKTFAAAITAAETAAIRQCAEIAGRDRPGFFAPSPTGKAIQRAILALLEKTAAGETR